MADDFDFKIEGINLDELDDKGKALYSNLEKQFKGAYTKKTQSLSDERRSWEKEKEQLSKDMQTYKEQVEGFSTWWAGLTPQQQDYYNQLSPGQQQQVAGEFGLDAPQELQRQYQAISKDVGELRKWGGQIYEAVKGMETKIGSVENAVAMSMDWTEFRAKHPDADRKRIFDRMTNEGIKNFDLAYELEYKDELLNNQVEAKVSERTKEIEEKMRSESKLPEFSPGRSSAIPAKEELPTTRGDATSKFKEGFMSTLRGTST